MDGPGDHGSEDGSILGGNADFSEDDDGFKSGAMSGTSLSEINTNRALQKLENETQRVSKNIVEFSTTVERMHTLLEGPGTRSCVDVFSQILMSSNATPNEETRSMTGSSASRRRAQSYGRVNGNLT
jgi:hypothetical protein